MPASIPAHASEQYPRSEHQPLLLWQALRGQSLIAPGGWAMAVGLALLIGGAIVLHARLNSAQ